MKKENLECGMLVEMFNSITKQYTIYMVADTLKGKILISNTHNVIYVSELTDNLNLYESVYIRKIYGKTEMDYEALSFSTSHRSLIWEKCTINETVAVEMAAKLLNVPFIEAKKLKDKYKK